MSAWLLSWSYKFIAPWAQLLYTSAG